MDTPVGDFVFEQVKPTQMFSEEIFVACAIYEHVGQREKRPDDESELSFSKIRTARQFIDERNSRKGISFTQLQQVLAGTVSAHGISRCLDILLDHGMISPQNGVIHDESTKKRYRVRLYLPGEIAEESLSSGLARLVLKFKGQDKAHRAVEFEVVDTLAAAQVARDLALINYTLRLLQMRFNCLQEGITRSLAYKTLANLFKDLERYAMSYKSSIAVSPYCYGPIPFVPQSSTIRRRVPILAAAPIGGWTQNGNRMRSAFQDEDAVTTAFASDQELWGPRIVIERLVDTYLEAAERFWRQRTGSEEIELTERRAAIFLNYLAIDRSFEFMVECAEFENQCRIEWLGVLSDALNMWDTDDEATLVGAADGFIERTQPLSQVGIPCYLPYVESREASKSNQPTPKELRRQWQTARESGRQTEEAPYMIRKCVGLAYKQVKEATDQVLQKVNAAHASDKVKSSLEAEGQPVTDPVTTKALSNSVWSIQQANGEKEPGDWLRELNKATRAWWTTFAQVFDGHPDFGNSTSTDHKVMQPEIAGALEGVDLPGEGEAWKASWDVVIRSSSEIDECFR